MLPSRGVRVWVVYLTPKIERIIVLLSASPEGEARCRCRKVWLTRNDYYYYYIPTHPTAKVFKQVCCGPIAELIGKKQAAAVIHELMMLPPADTAEVGGV
jgi:hypothetical protein